MGTCRLAGHVGYIYANLKSTDEAQIGDTLCNPKHPVEPLPGFKPAKAMVHRTLQEVKCVRKMTGDERVHVHGPWSVSPVQQQYPSREVTTFTRLHAVLFHLLFVTFRYHHKDSIYKTVCHKV